LSVKVVRLTIYFLTVIQPVWKAFLTRILYSGRSVSLGRDLRVDKVPRILVDAKARLVIGDNVELRRDVEIRVHGNAEIIIGNNVRIDRGVRILAANNSRIQIGEGTRIGLYTVFNGGDSISVGKKVLISGFVYLQTSMHGFARKDEFVQDQGYLHKPVVLEDDVWLGTHVVILPGCLLGKGAVVGSNAVVTKNVSEFSVVGGIPAIEIKTRV
jgi:acetyltransferase-like isoleucine patch superfamily enzyme